MTYPAKKDFGTACAFIVFVLAFIGFGVCCIAIEGPDGGAAVVVAGIALVLTAFLWVWFWFGTNYEITFSHVIVRCGPIKWRIKKDEIVEAVPTSSKWLMLGGSHARFALSADAIMIKYRNKNGRKWLGFIQPAVLISPQDKAGFLQALAEGSTDLEQSDDGRVRLRPETAG
jgi:hypothetical protein